MSRKKKKPTRRNHYVQQELQKRWANDGETPIGLRMNAGSNVRTPAINTVNSMVQNDLYTVSELKEFEPDFYETEMGKYETELLPKIDVIVAKKLAGLVIDAHDKTVLLRHLAFQGLRMPSSIGSFINGFEKFYEAASVDGVDNIVKWLALHTTMKGIERVPGELEQLYDLELKTSNNEFFLGDQPILQYINGGQLHPNLGITLNADQIILPINPSVAMVLNKKETQGMLLQLDSSSINDAIAFQSRIILSSSHAGLGDFTRYSNRVIAGNFAIPLVPFVVRRVPNYKSTLTNRTTGKETVVEGPLAFYPKIYDEIGASPPLTGPVVVSYTP